MSYLTTEAKIEYSAIPGEPAMIDANEFFREVTLRLCSHLEIEEGLQACIRYLSQHMPADTLYLERNEFELVPCDRVASVAGGSRDVIAFTFERENGLYAVYWHISADKRLELPLDPRDLVVLESMGSGIAATAGERKDTVVVPVGKRRYLKTSKSRKAELIAAFGDARILEL